MLDGRTIRNLATLQRLGRIAVGDGYGFAQVGSIGGVIEADKTAVSVGGRETACVIAVFYHSGSRTGHIAHNTAGYCVGITDVTGVVAIENSAGAFHLSNDTGGKGAVSDHIATAETAGKTEAKQIVA